MARPKGADILEYLHGRKNEFIAFLEELTLIKSPSVVSSVQNPLRSIIADRLKSIGFRTLGLSGQNTGGSLYARPEIRTRHASTQMLLGHYDTVWPLGTLKDMPFVVDGNTVCGPGVYDMKGGIAQIIFALEAITRLKLVPSVTPVVFVNSDEEIGSRDRPTLSGAWPGRCAAHSFLNHRSGPTAG